MINVTRHNAAQLIPDFQKTVSRTYFAAIDLEMSGLAVLPASLLPDHTPAQRYHEIKSEADYFSPLELGLSLFYITSGFRFASDTYNFVLNPLGMPSRDLTRKARFSASTVRFLRRNGFDFNRCFEAGLPLTRHHAQGKPSIGFPEP